MKIGTALHSESCKPFEVYRTLYDNERSSLWIRPSEMFHEEVSPGERRFTEIGRVRTVAPEEESTVLAFGYDAWGEGASVDDFVEQYSRDKNHLRGTRYLFELSDGEIIANVNTLRFSQEVVGLASLSVNPLRRRQGYASTLIRTVMEIMRSENQQVRFLLFSEVDPKIYERLGFAILPDDLQLHRPSIAMATGELPLSERENSFLREYF